MFNVSTYLLFVCAIRLESKMQGRGDLIFREAMLLFWMGRIFNRRRVFSCYVTKVFYFAEYILV